jgi:hypothetical protein
MSDDTDWKEEYYKLRDLEFDKEVKARDKHKEQMDECFKHMQPGWKPIATRNAVRRTRRYMYRGVETVVRHVKTGSEAVLFEANRRFPIPSGKYIPHQGARECARRRAAQ